MRKQDFFCAAIVVLLSAVRIPSAEAQTFRVLHEFTDTPDGARPAGALIRDAAGNLYGTTLIGGALSQGTVYKIDSTGVETILFDFSAFQTGANPASALIQDQAGNLYGTADIGPGGAGVVFKLSPQGEQELLFAFQGGFNRDPKVPTGALLMDEAGNIFGTTLFGGNGNCEPFGCGTIYRLDPAGTLQVLHEFSGGSDGREPLGPLVRDADGNLYGVARFGGDNVACPASPPEFPQSGCGTVFRLAATGKLTVLHTFRGGADGASPQPGLLRDTATGNLFGATAKGGNSENGAVFKISRNRTYTVLHAFNRNDGSTPNGSLVSDPAGNLYGTTVSGGRRNLGTAFAMKPTGQLKVLHNFKGLLDGARPLGGLIRDAAGHLYGAALENFLIDQQDGDVFEITP